MHRSRRRQSALIFGPEMARTDIRGYGWVVHSESGHRTSAGCPGRRAGLNAPSRDARTRKTSFWRVSRLKITGGVNSARVDTDRMVAGIESGNSVEMDVHFGAGDRAWELGLGHVEPHFEVAGREQRDHGGPGRHELAGLEERVVDHAVDGGHLGLLVERPAGPAHGGFGDGDLAFGGADLVRARRESGGFDLGFQRGDQGVVGVAAASGDIEFRFGERILLAQLLAARELEVGEITIGVGLGQASLEGGDLGGASTLSEIVQARPALRETTSGLVDGGLFRRGFQGEQVGSLGDGIAALRRTFQQNARDG